MLQHRQQNEKKSNAFDPSQNKNGDQNGQMTNPNGALKAVLNLFKISYSIFTNTFKTLGSLRNYRGKNIKNGKMLGRPNN